MLAEAQNEIGEVEHRETTYCVLPVNTFKSQSHSSLERRWVASHGWLLAGIAFALEGRENLEKEGVLCKSHQLL
jgi:hypothetical protein